MKRIPALLLLTGCMGLSLHAQTQPRNVLFVGVGHTLWRPDSTRSDQIPWSIGYLHSTSSFFVGFDFAGEGTMLDNTTGKNNEVHQGLSLNLLAGKNIPLGANARIGVGILAGARMTGKSCAGIGNSYLGFQCYADQDPAEEYALNYGAVLHLTVRRVLFGARVSGESVQGMLGVAF